MKVKDLKESSLYNKAVLPYHFAKAAAVGKKYNWPGKKLRVIGVTGTNGKTTTCFMVWKMLNYAGRKTGLMTTVAWGVDKLENQIEHMTTADVNTLNQRMQKILSAGAEFLVLEVTSHALAQFRTLGIPIEIAVMTNVTHEHLDYHKTFKNYVKAKCKLFNRAQFGVINSDDPSAVDFMQAIGGADGKYITYGIKRKADLMAKDIELKASGLKYSFCDIKNNESIVLKTQIPGEFNVYNSMAAAAVGRKLGLSDKQIQLGLFSLESVEGRMNRIGEGQDFEVIVDFAHTPDAFVKVFESVSPAYGGTRKNREKKRKEGEKIGRVISLFGGAGRRDESTRAERGEIAGKYSDIVVITEDDSRDEDPSKIAEMFAVAVEKTGLKRDESLLIELDRERAIRKALEMAKPSDVVLVLGKGHEKTILRANGAQPFEDIKVTRAELRKLIK